MIEILVGLLVILGLTILCHWVARQFGAPHPIPKIILVVGVVIGVLYLLANLSEIADELDDDRATVLVG